MKKISDYICFKPPTIYDIFMTVGVLFILCSLWFIRISQVEVQTLQKQMMKDYCTQEFIYYFYVNKDQIKMIEDERSNCLKKISEGKNVDAVNENYKNFVERVLSLTSRSNNITKKIK